MCLYPTFIKNRKYTPNKKNGGIVPKIKDYRVLYVPVGCGNCIECKKQKAREWKVRLNEELKNKAKWINEETGEEISVDQHAYYITLTFSNESLKALCKELHRNESNDIATVAVRRFTERWRKAFRRAPRHWLITELGHENTERIHLHGIMFIPSKGGPLDNEGYRATSFADVLQKIWMYGNVRVGEYCNAKTINYIIKYVTKIDKDHKGYKQIILCSKGLGGNYLQRFEASKHIFQDTKTVEYYHIENGARIALPIYYRNKLWNDEEREKLWLNMLDKKEIWVMGQCIDISTEAGMQQYGRVLKNAQEKNERVGYGSDAEEWKECEYNVTFKMLNRAKKKAMKH